MKLYNSVEDFNKALNTLIGQKILNVEYIGLNYSDEYENTYLTHIDNVHTMDLAILIYTENNVYEITWDSSFFQYGIGVEIHNNTGFKSESEIKWNVSNDTFWKNYLEKTIIGFRVMWDTINQMEIMTKKIEKVYTYPQTCRIFFKEIDDEIIVSVAEFYSDKEDKIIGFKDHLIVTNDVEIARKIKIL